jgi:hypothetical protein
MLPMQMLEYIKMILDKVSFDSKLFEKELKKGFKGVNASRNERIEKLVL